MRHWIFLIIFTVMAGGVLAQGGQSPAPTQDARTQASHPRAPNALLPYRNPTLPVDVRVSDLLGRMTAEEKIRQLDMYWGHQVSDMNGHEATGYDSVKIAAMIGTHGIGSIHDFYPVSATIPNEIQHYALHKTRLGIPVLFIEEGLHGFLGLGATTFPVPIGLSSTWDTDLVRQIGHVIGSEARAHGVDMILGPVLGLARDPRWGRVMETYGENPYLNAACGVAIVKGMQGLRLADPDAVIAEPKHFAVHSIPQGGSNTSPVNMGEREARSSFLYVFERAVREGKAMGIMAAYSELDGIPCVDNYWLLTEVLRKEWGFRGFVLSDLGAIKMSLMDHRVARDTSDALAQTLKAGLDMQFYDFGHESFVAAIEAALADGELTMKDLDRATGDVLRVKFLLGLFDHPYTDVHRADEVYHTPQNQDLALRAARESIVLLKNDSGLLPLDGRHRRIAVFGPLARSTYMGDYTRTDTGGISVLDGLHERAGDSLEIGFAEGYRDAPEGQDSGRDFGRDSAATLRTDATELLSRSDVGVVVLGEGIREDGEGKDRAHLNLGLPAQELLQALYATGKPLVVVLFNGRPLTINWAAAHIPAIVESWYAGEKGGPAVADVLLGKVDPSGRLPITFPRSLGQEPFYSDEKQTSLHRYVDEVNTPLYPFGWGLSYTQFAYSNLQVSPAVIGVDGKADVSVTVTNTGNREGTEVVELYTRQEVGSVTTPARALRGFGRISLAPGQSGAVHFTLGPEQLSLWNRQMNRVVEPGAFDLMVGRSSSDIVLRGSLLVRSK